MTTTRRAARPAAPSTTTSNDRSRRRAWRATPSGLAPSMAPMIDVVFLLLMYFLLAADFSAREEIFRLDLPDQAGIAAPDDPFRLDQEPLRIRLSSTGPGPRDLSLALEDPHPRIDGPRDLERFLRSSLLRTDGGLFAEDHPILIEPDGGTMWDHAVATFDAAVKAGYTNVIFVRLP